jgi:hypothetical protein
MDQGYGREVTCIGWAARRVRSIRDLSGYSSTTLPTIALYSSA